MEVCTQGIKGLYDTQLWKRLQEFSTFGAYENSAFPGCRSLSDHGETGVNALCPNDQA